jgi:hypothetical protein
MPGHIVPSRSNSATPRQRHQPYTHKAAIAERKTVSMTGL